MKLSERMQEVGDKVMFCPMDAAARIKAPAPIRFIALILSLPIAFLTTVIGAPLLIASVLVEIWEQAAERGDP